VYGLSVRWSLRGVDPGVAEKLRDYVRDTSLEKFTGMAGLSFKTWRMVEGEWFEGTYVFASRDERDRFLAAFIAGESQAAGSVIIGSPPSTYELVEVVAVAEGGAGFQPGMGPGTA
jgi:hypothetical protein